MKLLFYTAYLQLLAFGLQPEKKYSSLPIHWLYNNN